MIELWLNVLVFIVGFFILVKGSDTFIEYVGQLGTRLGLKKVVVGLLLVSIGTSLPELSITLFALSKGSPAVSLGTIIGSNIANIALFLGFAGFGISLVVKKDILTKEIPFMIFSLIMFYVFMIGFGTGIGRIEGVIMILLFFVYLYYLFKTGTHNKKDPLVEEFKADPRIHMKTRKIALYTFFGLGGLLIGSNVIVDSGIAIARIIKIDEAIIGLSAIAIGTSLPDITASLTALRKREDQIAFGNIVGSTIFNTLLVGGIAAITIPLSGSSVLFQDGLIMILFGVLLLPFVISGLKLTKNKSYIILALYFSYLLFVLLR